ncbi:uncharacterized protein LDX57_003970 [Aspergillus melleus]|uniref:uncharacterized protein n=1 Tax=Aspergillus melleus TaxID=138277 RepID=UPI001E8E1913|nr:uncharacterized protein LDX57_003970 [Aspergillus melleus]KAH8426223.1 hypothetical protein LDX57_003970 [Aspergillus melleus]
MEQSRTASVGELNANCEAKIMADDGVTELGRNQRGELWVRGQNVMKGYWRNPEATRETKTSDGWLKTGDIAFVDDEGKFHVVDRKKVGALAAKIAIASSGPIASPKCHANSVPGVDQSQRQSSCAGRARGSLVGTFCSCRRCSHWRASVSSRNLPLQSVCVATCKIANASIVGE